MRKLTDEEKAEILGLKAQIKAIKDRRKVQEVEYPKDGTRYWTISYEVWTGTWTNDLIDKARFDSGNYYETEQEADLEFEWRLLNTRILRSIAILNKEYNWVVDWNNLNQKKWFLCWDMEACELKHDYYYRNRIKENNKYYTSNAKEKLLTLYTQEEFKFWITKEKGK